MSADNVQNTLVWLAMGVAGVILIWVVLFFVHVVFLTPHRMWVESGQTSPSQTLKNENQVLLSEQHRIKHELEHEISKRKEAEDTRKYIRAISEIEAKAPSIYSMLPKFKQFPKYKKSQHREAGKIYLDQLRDEDMRWARARSDADGLLRSIGYEHLTEKFKDMSLVEKTPYNSVVKEGEPFDTEDDKDEFRRKKQESANIHSAIDEARQDALQKLDFAPSPTAIDAAKQIGWLDLPESGEKTIAKAPKGEPDPHQ